MVKTDNCHVSHSLLHNYLDWLEVLMNPSTSGNQLAHKILPTEPNKGTHPFLSIITRTQGKRPETLTEILNCLEKQTCMDFELLIIGHKLTHDGQKSVESILKDRSEKLQSKTRLIKVDTGTRTTPLNVGFTQAKGDYIAILDDDDLVFENWVESFHQLSIQHPGTVLHAYAITQDWMEIIKPDGKKGTQSCGKPNYIYCKNFEFINQIALNYCPLMTLAFPSYAFSQMNIHFDETLNTTEDWDFTMRTAFVCGVSDIPVVSSVYRKWVNMENSQTLHNQQEWQENYATIVNKFDEMPILLPKGSASKLIDLIQTHNSVREDSLTCTLYIDNGNGYSENRSHECVIDKPTSSFECCYTDLQSYSSIQSIRWDPGQNKEMTLEKFEAEIITQQDEKLCIKLQDISSNGIPLDGQILFLAYDPEVFLPIPKNTKIKQIKIIAKLALDIEATTLRRLTTMLQKNIVDQQKQLLCTLYVDSGSGYSEQSTLVTKNQGTSTDFCYEYNDFKQFSSISSLRWDPCESNHIAINSLKLEFKTQDGQTITQTIQDVASNSIKSNGQLLFLKSDPQIYIKIPKNKKICQLKITGELKFDISDEQLNGMLNRKFWLQRVFKKV